MEFLASFNYTHHRADESRATQLQMITTITKSRRESDPIAPNGSPSQASSSTLQWPHSPLALLPVNEATRYKAELIERARSPPWIGGYGPTDTELRARTSIPRALRALNPIHGSCTLNVNPTHGSCTLNVQITVE